ncbi:MAG: sulfatase [Prevotella sp.]|jgi:arylsulfatase|nr:sulfatase [Prevotella sp.]MCH4181556.1 sulfatase [Prevotella sp.]MCH4212157.1 sulfatase [Prevotella sp.]MCH4241127.1 sulfatase [Prevotella sp.]
MKSLTLTLGIAALTLASQSYAQKKPNIVLFYMDDMGMGDLSLTGARGYTTPNIDGIAHEGMYFTNYYASSAISTASRAGLLTGCYSTRVGAPGCYMINPKEGLDASETTLPEMLQKIGYNTALIGKWHLGCGNDFSPLKRGFKEFFGTLYSNDMWPVNYDGTPCTDPNNFKSMMPELRLIDGDKTYKIIATLDDQAQLTTLYTERAIRYINNHAKKPFFLEICHNMPHVPLAVSDKFKGKSKVGLYGDVMMELDWSVGQILSTLKEKGLEKNTIVIFTSDNGPWLTFGNYAGSNGGLREGKQTSFEGGQHLPCIIKWPGKIPAGVVNPQLICNLDFLPTFAAITGAKLPTNKIDGINVLSLLKGNTTESPRKYFYYYYSYNPAQILGNLEAVRDNQFKLVFDHKYNSNEDAKIGKDGFPGQTVVKEAKMALYDLRNDPGERMDVKDNYPKEVEKLQKAAQKMREDLGDNLQNMPATNARHYLPLYPFGR